MAQITENPTIDLQSNQQPSIYYLDDGIALFACIGNPEGFIAANAGSIATDINTGNVYQKTTSIVNTGWNVIGGGGGTINPGVANAIAYYPTGGTTIDDTSGFIWQSISPNVIITSQNTTHVALRLNTPASPTANPFEIQLNNVTKINVTSAGQLNIAAPTSAVTSLNVTGPTSAYAITGSGSGTTSGSFGLFISAGTNSNDFVTTFSIPSIGSNPFRIRGDSRIGMHNTTFNSTLTLQSQAAGVINLFDFNDITSNTNTMTTFGTFNLRSSGAVGTGLGGALVFGLESTTTEDRDMMQLRWQFTDATDASRTADCILFLTNNAVSAEAIRFRGNGQLLYQGLKRATADLVKTSSATFSDITGMSVNLVAGRTYKIKLCVYFNMTATVGGGAKITLTGTATASAALGSGWAFDSQTSGDAIAGSSTRLTAIDGTTPIAFVIQTTNSSGGTMWAEATILCNGSGNLRVQGAQTSSDADSTTFLANSTMEIWEISN